MLLGPGNQLSRQDGPLISQPSSRPHPGIVAETAELSVSSVMSIPSRVQIQHTGITREISKIWVAWGKRHFSRANTNLLSDFLFSW